MSNPSIRLLVSGLLAWAAAGTAAWADPARVADTGYIHGPALVSAGMANITVTVPAQAGASYAWSLQGGTLTGALHNASTVFTAGAAGTATVTCLVTLNGTSTQYSQDIPVLPPAPVNTAYYGSGMSADALANTVLGGPYMNSVSYRFQARHASALTGIRVFFIWSLLRSGYQAGAGGTIQVELHADDGTAAHLPTGPALASLSYGNILAQNQNYPLLTFDTPAVLTGGRIYHLVFTNVDPAPMSNYISLDALYTNTQTSPEQPTLADYSFAVLQRAGTGPWKPRYGFTPILQLNYADGGTQGAGYMEVWSTNPKPISGNAMVRETFKVSGPNRLFTRLRLRVRRDTGNGPLTATLTEADGTTIEASSLDAAGVLPGVYQWVTFTFPLSHVLSTGVAYNIAFSTPADTQYSAYPIRKGTDKGFSNYTLFPDGYAQFTSTGASGWTGWNMWGTSNLKTSDLQFYFLS